MAIPNTFNPVRDVSFNPIGQHSSKPASPFSMTENPFIPSCGDQNSLLKQTHHDLMNSYVNTFGQPIIYQPIKYKSNTHNFLYGDDPTSGFHFARKLKAVINFASFTTFLTKFGIMSDEEMTIFIPIQLFQQVWGAPNMGAIYPLAGDLFLIPDAACDRPLGQTPMVFEVTEKEDKEAAVDYMGGHYTWKITAKRFQYSYEPNAPKERFSDETPSDTDSFGRMPDGDNPPDLTENPNNVDDFAKGEFNIPEENSSVYGRYN